MVIDLTSSPWQGQSGRCPWLQCSDQPRRGALSHGTSFHPTTCLSPQCVAARKRRGAEQGCPAGKVARSRSYVERGTAAGGTAGKAYACLRWRNRIGYGGTTNSLYD